MPHAALSATLARTRAVVAPAAGSDGDLVGRFARTRDEAAFAELVRRLGPMVLGACRRVAGNSHLADDAFQAAFLVLARRAADVRPREAVRGWMYGVAVRTAREARTVSARRLARECPVPVLPDRACEAELPDADALRILDEEVAALPDHLRAAVVLCELDGLSRRDAARRLGVAEGTLSSRLAKARKVLAERLRRRGVALPAGLGAVLAASPVSARLAHRTSVLLTADPVPPAVALLTKGVFRTMYLQKLAAVCLVAVFVAVCVAASPSPAPEPRTRPVVPPTPARIQPREGVIVATSFQPGTPIELFTPEGKELGKPPVGAAASPINPGGESVCPLWLARLSPNAKKLAAIKLGPIPQGNTKTWTPNHLWVFDLTPKGGPPQLLAGDLRYPSAAWGPDSTKLYVAHIDPLKIDDPPKKGVPIPMVGWVYDFATKGKTPLSIPPGHMILDVSPDGKTLLTVELDIFERGGRMRTFLIPLDTMKPRLLVEGTLSARRFSPDGKWILGSRVMKGKGAQLAVVSVADGTEKPIPLADGAEIVLSACWSPDGKRVAYHWQVEVPPPPGVLLRGVDDPMFFDNRVTVCDLDGQNAKTIVHRDLDYRLTSLDWR